MSTAAEIDQAETILEVNNIEVRPTILCDGGVYR